MGHVCREPRRRLSELIRVEARGLDLVLELR